MCVWVWVGGGERGGRGRGGMWGAAIGFSFLHFFFIFSLCLSSKFVIEDIVKYFEEKIWLTFHVNHLGRQFT